MNHQGVLPEQNDLNVEMSVNAATIPLVGVFTGVEILTRLFFPMMFVNDLFSYRLRTDIAISEHDMSKNLYNRG